MTSAYSKLTEAQKEVRRAIARRWSKAHPNETRAQGRKWRAANPGKAYENKRKWLGMPDPTRPRPEHCENCGRLPNGHGRLHLDHDHKTGKFRGWLCHSCNTGLGHLGDSVESLIAAIHYLKRSN